MRLPMRSMTSCRTATRCGGIGRPFGQALDHLVEARIVAGEAGVAQPERRRQGRRLDIAQPLVGAAVFVDAVHRDLDAVVPVRRREGRHLVAVAVDPFRALARPVDAPGDDALAGRRLGREPHVVDRMAATAGRTGSASCGRWRTAWPFNPAGTGGRFHRTAWRCRRARRRGTWPGRCRRSGRRAHSAAARAARRPAGRPRRCVP